MFSLFLVTTVIKAQMPDPIASWNFENFINDTTVADNSGNGFDGTFNGIPIIVPGHDGGSAINFNDGFTYMRNDTFTVSLDFSIAMWVKWPNDGVTGDWDVFYEFDRADWEQWNALAVESWAGSDSLVMSMVDDSWSFNTQFIIPLNFTQWHHVVYTRDADNSAKFYIDGVVVKEGTEEFAFAVKTAPLFIGGNYDGESANAILDDVEYFDQALTPEQVWKKVHGDAPKPIASWDFETIINDTIAIDEMRNEHDGTFTGIPTIVQSFDGGNAVNFNDGAVYMATDSTFQTSLNFTVAMWIKWDSDSIPTDWSILFEHNRGTWDTDWPVFATEDRYLEVKFGDWDNWDDFASYDLSNINTEDWHHVVMKQDVQSVDDTIVERSLYLDGEKVAYDNLKSIIQPAEAILTIGGNFDGEKANAIIDKVKYFDYALADDEIRYLGPGPAFLAAARWDFENIVDDTIVIDASGNGYDGTLKAMPSIVPGYDGGTAVDFNDGTQYMVNDTFTSSVNFTLAMWVKWPETGPVNSWNVMYEFDRADWEQWNAFVTENGDQLDDVLNMTMVDDSWSFNSQVINPIDFSEWHHIAYSRDSLNNFNVYIDGNKVNTGVEDFGFSSKTAPLFIGGNNDGEFASAKLDNVFYFSQVLSDIDIAKLAEKPSTIMYPLSVDTTGNGYVTAFLQGNPNPVTDTMFAQGTELMLTATPYHGFAFLNWSGDVSSTDDTIYITMDSAVAVTAHFEGGTAYSLTLETGGNGQGSIDGESGMYKAGMDVELTAIPDTGFVFSGWDGDVSSTDNPLTITMNSDLTVIALFNFPEYMLTIDVDGNGSVTPESGMYGGEVTVVATPDEGYHFVSWSGDIESTAKTLYIMMDSAISITAHFAEGEASSLTAHWPIDAGTDTIVYDISGNHYDGVMVGGEWDEGRPGTDDGQSIHITSHDGGLPDYLELAPNTPQLSSADLSFAFWVKFNSMPGAWTQLICHGGDDFATNGEHYNDFAFVTDGDDHVNMIQHCTMGGKDFHSWFPSNYVVTTDTWIHMAVTINEADSIAKIYINGNLDAVQEDWVTLSPDLIPNKTRFGVDVGGYGGVADMNVDDIVWFNKTLTDEEVSALVGGVNLTTVIAGAGTIGGSITQDTDTLVSMMPTGGLVNLTATPIIGGSFINWTGDVNSSDETITFNIDSAMTITANFEDVTVYNLAIAVSGDGTVSPEGGKYAAGYEETLTATPKDSGYKFVKWIGDIESIDNPLTITMNSDISVTAVFEEAGYQLTVTKAGTGSGTVTPENGVYTGSQFLTAVADEGSTFIGWSGDVEGSTSVIAIYMDGPKNVTATFNKSDGINDPDAVKFDLSNYPNPFTGKTTIKYSVDETSRITLAIYDVFGRKVDVLVDKTVKSGNYTIEWDGTKLPKGIYLYQLQGNLKSITKRMVLNK